MKKRIPLIAFLIFVLICSIGCLVACGRGGLKISAETNGFGTVQLSADSAKPGESITVTMTPDEGYCVESVILNDNELETENNTAVFFMPNTDAKISVTFGKIKHNIDITAANGGTIECEESYSEGDSVTLSVKPEYGYQLSSLTVGGSEVTVTDNKYTFTMPANAVSVVPVFTTSAEVKALPSGSVLEITAKAPAGGTAKATLFVEFGKDALEVKAFVEDEKIITAKDGLSLCFGTTDYADAKISDKNVKVQILTDGTVTISKGTSGSYVAKEVAGISATVEPWSKESGKVAGYEVTASAAYTALGVTAANAEGKLTLLPVLVNGDKTGLAFGAAEVAIDEYHNINNADTYPAITAAGFADNRFMFGRGEFGSYKGTVAKGVHWNVSKDYESTSADYANREVTLNGHDGADNNIAMYHAAGKTVFAKATFKVHDVYNRNDQYPKFGFMIYDTSALNTGTFFYVDAVMNKANGNTVDDIVGTSLGYVVQNNGGWNWDGGKELAGTAGSFSLATKEVTLAITYNKGFVYMYRCDSEGDTQVGVMSYRAKGDVVIGVKSFGLGLKLTDYYATNDPKDEQFVAHNTRIDGTTVGDSESGYAYTEGWTLSGDIATNTGTGDQKLYIKGVEASKEVYAEAEIQTPNKIEGSTDEWTKAGMMLENENFIIFGYIDLRDNAGASERIKPYFAVRNLTNGNWTWDLGTAIDGTTIEDKATTLGIAKIGATIYLLQNGKVIASYNNYAIANEEFVAGVLVMNRYATATKGYATIKSAEINEKLGTDVPEEVDFDGVLDDDIWTESVLNSAQTFNVDKKAGTKIEVAAVMGQKGVFIEVTLYTATLQTKFTESNRLESTTHVSFKFEAATDGNKNNRVHYVSFFNTLNGGVSSSVSIRNAAAKVESVTLSGGAQGYKTVVECFVPYMYFDGYTAGAEKVPFYVWTTKVDDRDIGAMNSPLYFNKHDCYVTPDGYSVDEK